jgi:hypothetical protein
VVSRLPSGAASLSDTDFENAAFKFCSKPTNRDKFACAKGGQEKGDL